MSSITSYEVQTPGEKCLICLEDFAIGDHRFSCPGGEAHGSHKGCLADWVIRQPHCPFDRTPLDPTSILTMKDFIVHRMDPAFYNASIAVITGLAATCAAGLGGLIAANAAGGFGLVAGAFGVTVGALTGLGIGAEICDTLELSAISQQNIAIGSMLSSLSASLSFAAAPAGFLIETATIAIVATSALTASALTFLRGY